jgi:hypothetical protein
MNEEIEKKVKQIIEKSGNNLHCRAIKFLKEKGWDVLVSPYYSDIITNKPREIDIIAQKLFLVDDYRGLAGKLYFRLFIECKYIKQDTVFWFDKKDYVRLGKKLNNILPFETYNQYGNFNEKMKSNHYYKGENVAKIFKSDSDKNFENELIYGALNQSLNSLVYYKNEKNIFVDNSSIGCRLSCPEWFIDYPIVLVDNYSKFFKVEMDNSAVPSEIDSSFQLETNYSYFDREKNSAITDYFLVDVVSEGGLEEMLNNIEKNDVFPIKGLWVYKIREDSKNYSEMQSSSDSLDPYNY